MDGKGQQARNPKVLRGTGQLDPEDSLWMPGQLPPLEGQCGQKNSSRRSPVFHGSVGEAPGSQFLAFLRTHLFVVRVIIRASGRMASG